MLRISCLLRQEGSRYGQTWPVDLLVQLEPQIRDVRLMEKYLTNEQVEEYVRMLQPMEIDDSTNDTAIG